MSSADHRKPNGSTHVNERTLPAAGATLPPRLLIKLWTRAHVTLNRLSGGHAFNTMNGDEVCFVTMTGAKTNRQITIPLMYVPFGDGVLLVASLGGAPRNPIWYGNLIKHPHIDVRYRTHKMQLTARLASAQEKPALWPICDTHYAPYADYRAKTSRDIPIFVCEPRQ